MIASVKISNFQSHKKTELNLSSGINVLIGTSDSGKSAILRALNWLINNRPQGESFKSNWGGDTAVAIETEHTITRSRTSKFNGYIINNTELAAVKAEVPEEIRKALNFDDINIQQQMDSPFLLGETSGEVARYLNKVVNLDKIDSSLFNIEKQRKESNRYIAYQEDSLKTKKEDLEKYDFVDKLEEELNRLLKVQNAFSLKKEKYGTTHSLVRQIAETQGAADQIVFDPETLNKVGALDKLFALVNKNENKIVTIKNLVTDIEYAREKWKKNKSTPENSKRIENLRTALESIKKKNTLIGSLSVVLAVEGLQAKEKRCSEQIQQLKNKEKELTPDACPLCGAKIK